MTTDRPTDRSGLPDPDPLTALQARARRGAPRGADAVLAAARRDAAAPAPLPLDPPARRRWATAAAAVVVATGIVVGAAALGRSGDDGRAVTGGDGWCAALDERAVPPEGVDPDLFLRVVPSADQTTISGLRGRLDGDERVDAVHYVDATASYERFRQLFEGEDVILDNVRPDEIPTTFEVRLVPGASVDEVVADYRADPGAFDVSVAALQHARVLDLLAVTGLVPAFRPTGPVAADWAPFAEPWPGRLRAARDGAPPEVAEAIALLGDELHDRWAPTDEPPEADPTLARAARTLVDAAASTCGIEPAPWTEDDAAFAGSGAAPSEGQPSGSGDLSDPDDPSATTTTAGP